jgi:N-acetylneuraminic acid mutarotase
MKKSTLYLILLLTLTISNEIMAQNAPIQTINWERATHLPPNLATSKYKGIAGAISGTSNGVLVVAGGNNFPVLMPWLGGKKVYYDDIFIFKNDPGKPLTLLKERFKLPFNLAYPAVCSTANGIIAAGGENEQGLSKRVLLLQWLKTAGILKTTFLPEIPFAVTNAALTSVGNIIYLAGGEDEHGAIDQLLFLNLDRLNEGWSSTVKLPQPVSHTVLVSNGTNMLYLVGGRKRNEGSTSTLYQTVDAFHIPSRSWISKRPLPYALSASSGIYYEGQILLFSGDQGKTFNQTEGLIAAIAQEANPETKEGLNQQKVRLQNAHPGFSKQVLVYDISSDEWKTLKTKLPIGPVTTQAVLMGDEVILAGGEIKAGVRTDEILMGKIKK